MRIVRYRIDNGPVHVGLLDDDDVIESSGTETWDVVATEHRVKLADVELLPAVSPSATIVCVGLNYRDHAAEAQLPIPVTPVLFAKFSSTLNRHEGEVPIPLDVTQQVDYEAELGVVIGSRVTRVAPQDALDHVLGYTCVNDISARDLQFADGQWVRGKSVDGFGPVGPAIVTADEVGDPQDLRVRCRVNGQTVQDASTSEMIFSVAELVSFISQTITLQPGDLICTGTPAGVGVARDPKLLLQPGDVVEVEIDKVGLLRNRITQRTP